MDSEHGQRCLLPQVRKRVCTAFGGSLNARADLPFSLPATEQGPGIGYLRNKMRKRQRDEANRASMPGGTFPIDTILCCNETKEIETLRSNFCVFTLRVQP